LTNIGASKVSAVIFSTMLDDDSTYLLRCITALT